MDASRIDFDYAHTAPRVFVMSTPGESRTGCEDEREEIQPASDTTLVGINAQVASSSASNVIRSKNVAEFTA